MAKPDYQFSYNRRAFLGGMSGALGSLALSQLDAERGLAADHRSPKHHLDNSPGVTGTHHRPRAKAVICMFQHGGPSQIDLFDYKPLLNRLHGKSYSGDLETHFDKQKGNILGSPFRFSKYGQSGIQICEHLPYTGGVIDDLTLVRSMLGDSVDHEQALRLIHTGGIFSGRPTLGAWTIYALGTENRNVPSYVVLSDPGGLPVDGVRNWSSGFLPAVYQGTPFRSGKSPVLNLRTPDGVSATARSAQLKLLAQLNRSHMNRYPDNSELAARIENFEIAARMQTAVPDVLDLSGETAATKKMYGLDNPKTKEYGTRCLMARRLVEKGVRFVQLFLSGQPWDTHDKNASRLKGLCEFSDQPAAALVKDLKQRGLLDSTIVLWTGEFGRLPISQGSDGRDHNRHGFSLWLAGGGFKRGYAHGKTDDFGYKSVEEIVTVHDLHATLLHALGLDHRRLTYPHDGRQDSLSDSDVTGAKIVKKLLA